MFQTSLIDIALLPGVGGRLLHSSSKNQSKLKFLSHTRATNISILLTHVRLDVDELCEAIACGDPDEVLQIDKLTIIMQVYQ